MITVRFSRGSIVVARERERTRYLDMGSIMMSRGKLSELKKALKEDSDDRLKTYQGILKAHGCRNPVPVLYALGYDIEWARGAVIARFSGSVVERQQINNAPHVSCLGK